MRTCFNCIGYVILCILLVVKTASAAVPGTVLSQADVQRYEQIFKAHQKGDYKTAAQLENQLKNKVLLGYVLYDKYFSKAYRTKASEITKWFSKYADLAVSPDMYALGQQKKAALPRKKPRDIFGTGTGSCSYVMREDPIDLLSSRTFSYLTPEKRSLASRSMRRISTYLRAGKTLNARQLIESNNVRRLFSKTDLDAAKTALAFSYFLDGEDKRAAALITDILKRSGREFPQAYWTGGLVAWRQGNIQKAATYFEQCAKHKKIYPLLQASSAFWAARAYLRAGQYEKVSDFLEIAARHPRTFYGLLALRLTGRDLTHVWDMPSVPLEDDIDIDFSHPALTRFYALKQIGKKEWAMRELSQLYLTADSEAKSLLLMISEQNDFAEELLKITGKLKDEAVRYPAPGWTPQDGWKVDKALVFAFVLQESCFNPRAQSTVGALGLMQIMPETGRELARFLQYPWSLKRLKEPAYNLSLGQNYLLRLMKNSEIKNNLIFTAVAYNAGPGNLIKWKKKMNYMDDPLLFLESIPSRETRSFTERILVNYWIYRSLMNQPLSSLDETAGGNWPEYHPLEKEAQETGQG